MFDDNVYFVKYFLQEYVRLYLHKVSASRLVSGVKIDRHAMQLEMVDVKRVYFVRIPKKKLMAKYIHRWS